MALVAVLLAGCGGGGEPFSLVKQGAPAAPPPSSAPAAVEVYGVVVVPPIWLKAADVPPLEVAIAEYLDDASAALGGWRPGPGTSQDFALTVIFHDVRGANYWSVTTRTAWLEWPIGATGKPVSVAFAPLWHIVQVLDRRRAAGVSQGAQATQEENDCISRGLGLQVRLQTNYPQDFDP